MLNAERLGNGRPDLLGWIRNCDKGPSSLNPTANLVSVKREKGLAMPLRLIFALCG